MDTLSMYELMLTIRFFEEAIERLFLEGRIMGTAHTCIGQEAVAVGVAAALEACDAITTTHRGHGHFLARGADPRRAMAELFGRAEGYSRGRGGSQMMMAPELGFYGANGITGGSIPFATGLALDAQMRGSRRVTVCFLGMEPPIKVSFMKLSTWLRFGSYPCFMWLRTMGMRCRLQPCVVWQIPVLQIVR